MAARPQSALLPCAPIFRRRRSRTPTCSSRPYGLSRCHGSRRQRKWLARRAFEADLPEEVIARRKTTVPGHFEWLVADWRRRTGAAFAPLHQSTLEYVDSARLTETLHTGDTEQTMAGWRALELDAWFREEDR